MNQYNWLSECINVETFEIYLKSKSRDWLPYCDIHAKEIEYQWVFNDMKDRWCGLSFMCRLIWYRKVLFNMELAVYIEDIDDSWGSDSKQPLNLQYVKIK